MTIQIRRATAEDITGLLAVKNSVWPDETVTEASYAARVIAEPDHITLVAETEGRVAGFIDGFLTLAANGMRRWEVDLLAVRPDYRQRGLARQLIMAHTRDGFLMGADTARALIKTDNIASQRAFAACGYTCDDQPHGLYISADGSQIPEAALPDGYLIPVSTLNYRGLWVEGVWSDGAFRYAQTVQARHQYDAAGAVLPLDHREAVAAAERASFVQVGIYQWWFTTDAAPAPR